MESYSWWTDEQKEFAVEISEFTASIMPKDAETRWMREFPWDIFRRDKRDHRLQLTKDILAHMDFMAILSLHIKEMPADIFNPV
ncbi:MAG TPA: hypothetical protein VMT71_05830 [Syntrophorhabdales bacterium]|nr:hypothetical protein [Syntrophorhabdales bacterium]